MTTNSDLALAQKELAPPLFASPWMALYFALKNGWRRVPVTRPQSKR